MSSTCLPASNVTASSSGYNNVCLLSNDLNSTISQAFSTCCGTINQSFTSSGCYGYCNFTSSDEAHTFQGCIGPALLNDNINPDAIDAGCIGSILDASINNTATTLTEVSGGMTTTASGADPTTTSGKGASTNTAATTTTGGSSSASASASTSPSPTSKPSKASGGNSISVGVLAVVGLAVFGLLA